MSRQIWFLRCLLGLLVAVIIVFLITHNRVPRWTCGSSCRSQTSESVEPPGLAQSTIPVTMVVVTCGDRFEVTMANLKSAMAFSRAPLRLLLFADAENHQRLEDTIKQWPEKVLERITYELRLVRPPKGPDMIKECNFQRIFLPSLLPHEDAVLYVDSDVVFVHPVEDLWSYFGQMNDQHMTLMISDVEDTSLNPYFNRTRDMPRYKRYGLNSGVMLMNLTRMRDFGLEAILMGLFDEYQNDLVYRDQDLLNVVFHVHPEKVLLGECRWNFMHVACWSKVACKGQTPALVHGTFKTFSHPTRVKGMRAIGFAMQQYQLGTSLERNFVDVLDQNLLSAGTSLCTKKVRSFVTDWRKLARQIDVERGWNTAEGTQKEHSLISATN